MKTPWSGATVVGAAPMSSSTNALEVFICVVGEDEFCVVATDMRAVRSVMLDRYKVTTVAMLPKPRKVYPASITISGEIDTRGGVVTTSIHDTVTPPGDSLATIMKRK